jgi:hypothetical protein
MDFGKHWPKTYLIIYKVIAIKIIMNLHNHYFSLKIGYPAIFENKIGCKRMMGMRDDGEDGGKEG